MAASVVGRSALWTRGFVKRLRPSTPSPLAACGTILRVAFYNPRPLKLNLKDPYIPDRDSERTPEWQKSREFDRKLYGRHGSLSGVDAAVLWPTPEKLEKIEAEEREWQPTLEAMQKTIELRERELEKKRQARAKLVAANMEKMPKMVEDWRQEARKLKAKQREEKARREHLLAEAKERFGYALDPRSPKFQEMVKEIEKEEKRKKKLLKRMKENSKGEAASTDVKQAMQST
ncbi:growth arrest and DNA damage-inducible proteins-interacting protein 1 [Polypterus senegalus]